MKAVSFALLLMIVALGACFAGDGCDAEERAAFDAIDHFDEALVAEDHPYGTCAATFTADDADAVIDHYRSAFADAGYAVSSPEIVPFTDDSGATVGRAMSISATSDSMDAAVSSEVFDGAEPEFVIHVSHRADGR